MNDNRELFKNFILMLFLGLLVWVPVSMATDLNEHCVVSVLNRTVQVKSDGTWVLPNIPANFGPVRARATCVEDGITTSGQSDFFTIPANGSVDVPEIALGAVTPIANKITVNASPTTLTQSGQTVQLAVTGTYADGSTQDLSNSSTGTQYLISNNQIATITSDGLVTAAQSGTVLVQAVNEGAQGLLQLSVVLSADSDGDGIPDDVEIREGLDPNNPADALDDADRDGLTNKEELDRGTDLHKADTDGDGLLDGEEVKISTNPLLKDTDGDGVPDNIEIASGSDPLNPLSFDLAKSLKGIKVSPLSFTINVNSTDLIAYQQLQVTGEFTLGGTINLTSKARGTSYSSSNLQSCNFGAEDGRVYGGGNGSCTITVSNGVFSATATGSVKAFTPKALAFVSIPGFANNVDVNGNYVYVASGSTGLQVVDVSDKSLPKVVASLDTPGNGNDIKVVGNFAYLADDTAGLQIIDISDPLAPVSVGVYDTPGVAWDVVVGGGYAFVADGTAGLQIIDVSNPVSPSLVGSLSLPGTAKGVDIDLERNLAVIAAGNRGFHIVDIQNKAVPVSVYIGPSGDSRDVRDLVVNGNYVFLADNFRGLTSVDVSIPATPTYLISIPGYLYGYLLDIAISGTKALSAIEALTLIANDVPLYDISNPAAMQIRTNLSFAGFRSDSGTGIAVDGAYVYLTAEPRNIENGVIGDSRLYIGQYKENEDIAGIPPVVNINSPANGDTAVLGEQIAIKAQATDDVGIAAVKFSVNGVEISTDTTEPYQTWYDVPGNAGNLTINADAIDLGGNQAVSESVIVTTIPDPLTTIVGRVLDRNNTILSGAKVTCLGIEAVTSTDGSFYIPGVKTIQGSIRCSAIFNAGSENLRGVSRSVFPLRATNTDFSATGFATPLLTF